MDLVRLGQVIRAVRIRQRSRQADVALRADLSRSTISRLERGHAGSLSLDAVDRIARALEIHVDIQARWRGGDLPRLIDAAHAHLQNAIAERIAHSEGWTVVPELSFAVYGERGAMDLVAWHPPTAALLVVEVKTRLIDVQDLLGSIDRKRRLAPVAVADRGWRPRVIGVWVAMADSPTNRRHVNDHAAVLRAALPDCHSEVRAWFRRPDQGLRALSFCSYDHRWTARAGRGTGQRVRRGQPSRDRARRPDARA